MCNSASQLIAKCINARQIIMFYLWFCAWADLEKILGGGQPNKVDIKVAQLNVLLALQLRTLLVISKLPV